MAGSKVIKEEDKTAEMTPTEVPIGTKIHLRKTNVGWIASHLKPNSWDRIVRADKNLILALKKVIEIY